MRESERMEQTVLGERYIACGSSGGLYPLRGTPGNALGAYLDGAEIELFGNAQDATGDTMNAGTITIHGNTGDAAGYAMRGGSIYVRGDAGYRAGIHMKAYGDTVPALVIGGRAGSFLGEYQAGGIILVLGLGCAPGAAPVGCFCGTGMHGGRIYLRTETLPADLPEQVAVRRATQEDMRLIDPYLNRFCEKFHMDKTTDLGGNYYVLSPNEKSPYRMLYVYNWGQP